MNTDNPFYIYVDTVYSGRIDDYLLKVFNIHSPVVTPYAREQFKVVGTMLRVTRSPDTGVYFVCGYVHGLYQASYTLSKTLQSLTFFGEL